MAVEASKLPLLQVGLSSASLLALNQLPGGVPKAYLRVLSFTQDSVLVDQRTVQLTAAALGNYETLSTGQLIVQQDGYVSVYVGNESATDVYFDDVTIEHRQGLQIQENHYDPFGLDLAGVSGAAPGLRLKNFYQFNGKENQLDLGLNWSDYGARMYDAQLGRWHAIDPLAHKYWSYSPYNYVANNPQNNIDPDGKDIRESRTRYDKDGNEMHGFFSHFRKAASVVVNIEVTNFQVQNHSSENLSAETLAASRDLLKTEIANSWSTNGPVKDNKGRSVSVSVSISEEKKAGVKNDAPVIAEIVDYSAMKPFQKGRAALDSNKMTIGPESAYIYSGKVLQTEPDKKDASHEFGHMGGLEHKNGTIMQDGGDGGLNYPPDYKQLKKVFKGRAGI